MIMKRKLSLLIIGALAIVSIFLYVAAAVTENLLAEAIKFEVIAGALFLIMLAAYFVIRKSGDYRRPILTVVIAAAVVFRLVTALSAPTLSNDIYRYVWDGRIQAAGISPFKYAPNNPALSKFRTNGEYKNLKDNITSQGIYQPVAQMLFLASAPFGGGAPLALKFYLAFFDVATIFLLLKILLHLKRPPELIIFYAWSPLVVFEIAGSGHVDGLTAFLITAGVYLALKQRRFFAGALIGAAVATKLYPIALLPAITRDKRDWRTVCGAAAAILAIYMPSLSARRAVVSLANGTSGVASFNPGLKSLFNILAGSQSQGMANAFFLVSLVVLGGIVLYFWTRKKSDDGIIRAAFWIAGAIIILLPFTVPWYFVLVLPFAAIELAGSFIWLSGAVMLSYLYYAWQPWALPTWISAVEFAPFFALFIWELKESLRGKPLPLYHLIYKERRPRLG